MRIAAYFFLTLLFLSSFAEKCPGQTRAEIDSLYGVGSTMIGYRDDSTRYVGEQIIQESQSIGYALGVVRGEIVKGVGYLDLSILDSAAFMLLQAKNHAEDLGSLTMEQGLALNYLGEVYLQLNSLNQSLVNYQEALQVFDQLEEHRYRSNTTTNIGIIYLRQSDYPKALEYFTQAQKISLDENLGESRLPAAYTNTSIVLSRMGDTDQALEFAKKALQIDLKAQDSVGICNSYSSVGGVFKRAGQLDSAIFYYELCLAIAQDQPIYRSITRGAWVNIAEIYSQRENPREANAILQRVEQRWRDQGSHNLESVYNTIARNYLKLAAYDSAILFAKKAYSMGIAQDVQLEIRDATESYWPDRSWASLMVSV
ncbi:MAG: tetratricopeptide repeat protein, partial [Bacteroidota bacterium]